MNWDSRLLKHIDYAALFLTALLITIGMPIIASAVKAQGGAPGYYLTRQGAGAGIGLFLMILLALIDYSEFPGVARVLYYFNLGLLLLVRVPGIGINSKGAHRWVHFGPLQFQPSEPAKVILLITLANFLAHYLTDRERLDRWSDLILPTLHVLPAAGLVMLQPDLGTSLVMITMLGAMLFMAGVPGWRLAVIGIVGVALVSLVVYANLNWHMKIPLLQDYQIKRLTTFIDPESDPTDAAYQVTQGRIAVGSGGLWGKGLAKGTQNQLGFLSEQHTDWIFSVLGEELGFVGGAVLLLIYFLLLMRLISMGIQAKDQFGLLLTTGVAAMIAFHVIENVGMVLGVMPAAGIPLPFISYAPSSVVTNLAALGIALNVYMRRHTIMF